jgi:SAM-dependent methyltransferase
MTGEPTCRFCATPLRHVFVDLGLSPLANHNLKPGDEALEKTYPLITRVCETCLLVQADDSVPPEDIFSDYDYFSSFSDGWVAHAKHYCELMRDRFGLGAASLAVEVASNDGYLLQHFVSMGVPVLGIEPAANVAKVAVAKGVATEAVYFGVETAKRLAASRGKADLIAANNVLAHVPNTRDFVGGFAELLAPEGVATFEFPHVLNLIEQVQFDTIYHEHFFYLSLFTVEKMMAAATLRVFDVEELPTHGGSLRLYVCHADAGHEEAPRLQALRHKEQARGLDKLAGYAGFATRVAEVKRSFLAFVTEADAQGKVIAAYGAAAKGNTFLNYCGVDAPRIREVYDRNDVKQGKLTPGTHIPIKAPEAISALRPDYVVILPWNIADEVRRNLAFIAEWGGRFVTAVPETRIS